MKKITTLTVIAGLLCCHAYSQPENIDKTSVKGRSTELSLNINFPVSGYLKNISNISIGAEYSWSKERFGNMTIKPANLIGFTFNAGVDYFFGEKEELGTYSYKYDGTTYLHAYGGAIYNPCNRGNIRLTAGPSLELYSGESEFGFGVNLSGSYYLCRCGNFGITPNFTLMKQGSSEAVTVAGVKFNYVF